MTLAFLVCTSDPVLLLKLLQSNHSVGKSGHPVQRKPASCRVNALNVILDEPYKNRKCMRQEDDGSLQVSKNKIEKNNDYMAIIYTDQNYLNCITYPRTTCPFVSLLVKMVMYLIVTWNSFISPKCKMLCTPNESLSVLRLSQTPL